MISKPTVRASLLTVLLVAQCVIYFLITQPGEKGARVHEIILFSLILAALWIGSFWLIDRARRKALRLRLFWIAIVAGAIFRITLLFGSTGEDLLSDDVYRYIWDGKLTAHGINPFAQPANDPSLFHMWDNAIAPNVNHPYLPTIYPPASQALFLVSYWIDGDSFLGFKALSGLFDVLTLLALFSLLQSFKLRREWSLIYWLCPLILIEFSFSAHHDILALPFLIMGIVAIKEKRPVSAGILLAVATLIKFLVALTIPALFFALSKDSRLRFTLAAIATATVFYLPYLFVLKPPALFGSLTTYLSGWTYNSSIHKLLEMAFSSAAAKIISAVSLVALVLTISISVKDKFKAALLSLTAYICLTTTLFPWYLIILTPFLLIFRSSAYLALISLIFLSYWGMISFYETAMWYDNMYLRTLMYSPFYILLIWGWRENRMGRQSGEEYAF
ncbi:MAG: DUF2029 domain-containing protein [candidate division Zixibacteria bacterium]|nr:DUF2029 domain-containing protein [candidate division Zixibacteria bacterium]